MYCTHLIVIQKALYYLPNIVKFLRISGRVMCLSYPLFYLEMVKQLQPCEKRTKESQKVEQGWLRIKV